MYLLLAMILIILIPSKVVAETLDCKFISGSQKAYSRIPQANFPSKGTINKFNIRGDTILSVDELFGHGCYSNNAKIKFDGEKKFLIEFESIQSGCMKNSSFSLLPNGKMVGMVGPAWSKDRYTFQCDKSREQVVQIYFTTEQENYAESDTDQENNGVFDDNADLDDAEIVSQAVVSGEENSLDKIGGGPSDSIDEWCYEKDIVYPSGMFAAFSDKMKQSSKQVNKFFKFGKDTLPQKPHRMLFGLAYLEALVNELCFNRHNLDAQNSREKIEDIVLGLRESLGISTSFSRQKAINIYWSTGKLLMLANVEKLEIDEDRKANIESIRVAKASLMSALRKAKQNAK